jgi:outer membrane protein insertion porin family
VLKLNGTISRVGSLSPEKPVPISERFFEGGPNGVRGFERLSLGPRQGCANADPYASRSTCPVGGVKSLVFNGELEFPILAAVGLRGVMFADAGNAFDADQPYSFQLDFLEDGANAAVLRSAWGFGIRWQSPIGPLRFEWGNAAAPRAGESDQVFEFSIGNSF